MTTPLDLAVDNVDRFRHVFRTHGEESVSMAEGQADTWDLWVDENGTFLMASFRGASEPFSMLPKGSIPVQNSSTHRKYGIYVAPYYNSTSRFRVCGRRADCQLAINYFKASYGGTEPRAWIDGWSNLSQKQRETMLMTEAVFSQVIGCLARKPESKEADTLFLYEPWVCGFRDVEVYPTQDLVNDAL
ncbi:MAG: hypothetical protein KDK78_04385 [Chlamydiia bacterium]|nr:hypothetical protein [Chlamydiia bacterium]